jgi:hypothetical protein
MARKLSILLLGATYLYGCGGAPSTQPYYETTAIHHQPVTAKHRTALVKVVRGLSRKGLLKRRDIKGQIRVVTPNQVNRLKLGVLRAIQMFSTTDRRGAEADLIIGVGQGQRTPVSVTVDMQGRITFEAAARLKPAPEGKTWIPRFKNGNAPWTKAHRRALRIAMTQLSPAEAKVLRGMAFIRYKRSKDGRKGALYLQKNCMAEIRVYNRSFQADRWQFVGSAFQPLPSSTRTVLHEVGHAIHNRPSRTAFCQYEKSLKGLQKRISDYNRAAKTARRTKNRKLEAQLSTEVKVIERLKRRVKIQGERTAKLAKRGPVIDAYARVIGRKSAPTAYGKTSIRESFAESFSLYRADKAALRRLLPKVYDWFHAEGHLKAMGQ